MCVCIYFFYYIITYKNLSYTSHIIYYSIVIYLSATLDFVILQGTIDHKIVIISQNAIKKKEKSIEIIVLGERREVIGRMALEPYNYPAILSLSGRCKLAKQT